jgi:hypothetical protein
VYSYVEEIVYTAVWAALLVSPFLVLFEALKHCQIGSPRRESFQGEIEARNKWRGAAP